MKHSNWLTKAVISIFISVSALCVCSGSNPEIPNPNKYREKQISDSIYTAKLKRIRFRRDSLYGRVDTVVGTVTFRHGKLFEMLKKGFSKTNIPVARTWKGGPGFFPEIYRELYQHNKYLNPKDTFRYNYQKDTIFVTNDFLHIYAEGYFRLCFMWSSIDTIYYGLNYNLSDVNYIRKGSFWFNEDHRLISKWDLDSIRKKYDDYNNPKGRIYASSYANTAISRFIITKGEITRIDTISGYPNSDVRIPAEEDIFFNGDI